MALILVSSRQHGSASVPSTGVGTTVGGPVEFEHGNDEYRHRMQVNLLAAVLLIVLVGAGMWIADAMVDNQKAHGCYSSGQRFCSLI